MLLDILKALSETSLPEILAFSGVLFIFFSVGGKLGAQIITDNISKRYAAIVGVILLLSSLALFVVSTTIQSQNSKTTEKTEGATKTDNDISLETYKLRPTLLINHPISQVTEVEFKFSSSSGDKSLNCSSVYHKEDVFTVLGLGINGDPSVAKRKIVSELTTVSCNIAGETKPQIKETHGELEGKELLANKTPEGLWIFDELPGATEKQKKAMMNEVLKVPFFMLPREKVPIGKVIILKDEDVSLELGTAFPGKKEGTMAIKFEDVIKDRETFAQLLYSYDVTATKLNEDNSEVSFKVVLNGGGRLSLSENAKINSTATLTGIASAKLASPNVEITGTVTIKTIDNEL